MRSNHRSPLDRQWADDAHITLWLLLFVCGSYSLLLVQSFYPVTEGWFQDYSNYMANGLVMYRDFYMFIPPGFPLLMHAIGVLTDNSFLAFRLYGVAESLVLVALVYLLIRRSFSSRVAFVSILASFVAYTSNLQDVFYGYYQSSLLLAVLSLYFAVRGYETFGRGALGYPVLFGIASAILLLFKQSTGVIVPIAVGLTLFALTARVNKRRAVRNAGLSGVAYLVVVGLAIAVLAANQALIPALDEVIGGSSSKGSLSNVFFGFLGRVPVGPTFGLVVGVLGVAGLLKLAKRSKHRYGTRSVLYRATSAGVVIAAGFVFAGAIGYPTWTALDGGSLLAAYPAFLLLLLLGLIGVVVVAQVLAPRVDGGRVQVVALALVSALIVSVFVDVRFVPLNYIDFESMRDQRQYLVYAAFYLLPIYVVYVSVQLSRGRGGGYPLKLLVGVTAFSIMYIHGMSGLIEDHAILLAGSLLIGTVLSTAVAWPRVRDSAVYAGIALMVFAIVVQRNALPYWWWGVNELPPSWGATSTFDDPRLAGIYSNASYTEQMNSIYRLIEAYKQSGDTMYSFPTINYFNVMAGLPSPTYGKVDYIDVAPDSVAIRDAALLVDNPPTFIVWMEWTPQEWDFQEATFRGGRASGQRQIERAVEQLTSSDAYVHLGRFYVGESDPIDIYVLNDGRRTFLDGGSLDT